MSASVDVLAVMDAAAMTARAIGADEAADDFEAVRAAVAELIEAATRLHGRAEFEGFGREAAAELDAIRAALARVKGGAA